MKEPKKTLEVLYARCLKTEISRVQTRSNSQVLEPYLIYIISKFSHDISIKNTKTMKSQNKKKNENYKMKGIDIPVYACIIT